MQIDNEVQQLTLADLAFNTRTRVYEDDLVCALYSTDSSMYQVKPMAVISPELPEQITEIVRQASGVGLSITARGAGTGQVGACLNDGVILDCGQYLDSIDQIDLANGVVVVEPGCICESVNQALAGSGKRLPCIGDRTDRQTVGGMVASNVGGPHWPVYGRIAHRLFYVDAVLADGAHVRFWADGKAECLNGESELLKLIRKRIPQLLMHWQPRLQSAPLHGGYSLEHVFDEESKVNWPALLAGSEGTLAVLIKVALELVDVPEWQAAVVVDFDSLSSLSQALPIVSAAPVAACFVADGLIRGLAQGDESSSLGAPAMLIWLEGQSQEELDFRLNRTLAVVGQLSNTKGNVVLRKEHLCRQAWRTFQQGIRWIDSVRPTRRPLAGLEDLRLADPRNAPQLMREVYQLADQQGLELICCGHVSDGLPSLYPLVDLRQEQQREAYRRLLHQAYEKVWALEGSIGGARGSGLLRSRFLGDDAGELHMLMKRIKQMFDPRGVLNPGKVVETKGEDFWDHLRQDVLVDSDQLGESVLCWTADERRSEAEACSRCGVCRNADASQTMCPVFRFKGGEDASPRAHANLTSRLLDGTLESSWQQSVDVYEVASNCIQCGMCLVECPSRVDIPRLSMELKASQLKREELSRKARLRRSGQRTFAPSSPCRSIARYFGRFPVPVGNAGKVLLLVEKDWEKDLAPAVRAALDLLDAKGIRVQDVIAGTSADASIVAGDAEVAREIIDKHVPPLHEAVTAGRRIITMSPTTAWMISRRWGELSASDAVNEIARSTKDLMSFVSEIEGKGEHHLVKEGRQIDRGVADEFSGLRLVYYVPCRLRAIQAGRPSADLMLRHAGCSVDILDTGCCGMAGDWGHSRTNRELSRQIAAPMLKRLEALKPSIVMSECPSCCHRISRELDVPCVHPVELIAHASGSFQSHISRMLKRARKRKKK